MIYSVLVVLARLIYPAIHESTRNTAVHKYAYIPKNVDVRRGGSRAVDEPVGEIQPSVRRSPSYVPRPNKHPEEHEHEAVQLLIRDWLFL